VCVCVCVCVCVKPLSCRAVGKLFRAVNLYDLLTDFDVSTSCFVHFDTEITEINLQL